MDRLTGRGMFSMRTQRNVAKNPAEYEDARIMAVNALRLAMTDPILTGLLEEEAAENDKNG